MPGDPVNTKTLLLVLTLEVDFLCFAFGFFEIEITCCILLLKHIFCSVSSFSAVVGYSDNWSFLISPSQIIWSFPISPLQKALLNLLLLLLIFSLIIHPRLWQIFDCLFFFRFLLTLFFFKKQLYDPSKIRVNVQRFPMYVMSPQIHSLSPHQPPEQYIAYNRRTYMHTSQSPSLHSSYHGSLLVLYILWVSTNIWHIFTVWLSR